MCIRASYVPVESQYSQGCTWHLQKWCPSRSRCQQPRQTLAPVSGRSCSRSLQLRVTNKYTRSVSALTNTATTQPLRTFTHLAPLHSLQWHSWRWPWAWSDEKAAKRQDKGVWWVSGGGDRYNTADRLFVLKGKKEKHPEAQVWIMCVGPRCGDECTFAKQAVSLETLQSCQREAKCKVVSFWDHSHSRY